MTFEERSRAAKEGWITRRVKAGTAWRGTFRPGVRLVWDAGGFRLESYRHEPRRNGGDW